MAWITHRTIQQDQRHRPEVQVAGTLMDSWEHDIVANQNVYNRYLDDTLWTWMTISARRFDGDEVGDEDN
eukprot:7471902-Prorocentrum_lima.AAC.1